MNRPILFSTDMVRAILDGRKTQTRRIKFNCAPGDILWVRETFRDVGYDDCSQFEYKASETSKENNCISWKPSIYMPREAARLFLCVKKVRVERLQDIEVDGIIQEGAFTYEEYKEQDCSKAFTVFANLWDSLNAKRGFGWGNNPLVKVIEFRRVANG